MISYVVEQNLDDRILQRASQILRNGGLICFPTETNWVAACDPFNKTAVDKLYKLRHIENSKHLTVLCSSFQKAMEIALIDDNAFRLMKKVVPGPFTFILEAQKKITKYLKASKIDHQVGIKFPPKNLPKSLLEGLDGLLLSNHITHEMLDDADPSVTIYSLQIEEQFGHLIDLIIDPGETEFLGPTTIVDFTSGIPEVIRIGAGDPSLFQK